MAYVFDSIDQALAGSTPTTASDQSNIFAASPTPASGGSQAAVGNGDVKTSTSGDVTPAGTSSSSTPAAQTTSAASQNSNADVAKNTQNFSSLPSSYQASFDKVNSSLQNEANTYLSTESAKGSANNVDQTTMDSAINGDSTAQQAVNARYQATAPTVAAYQTGVDTRIPDLDSLNSSGGIADVMSRNNASDYTSGLAGLDAQLLGQNKDFIAARQNLNQSQAALKQKTIDDQTGLTKQAQAAALANFTSGTGQIKDYLTTKEQGLDAAAKQRMDAYNAQVAALSGGGYKSDLENQRAAAMAALSSQKSPQAGFVNLADYSAAGKDAVDASQYYKQGSAINDLNRFYDAPSAGQFNNIEALLGGTLTHAAGSPVGPVSSFDAKGYQSALQAAASKRLAEIAAEGVPKAGASSLQSVEPSNFQPNGSGIPSLGAPTPLTKAQQKEVVSDKGSVYDPGASTQDKLKSFVNAAVVNPTKINAGNLSKSAKKVFKF